jgi:hypothetical protein
MILDRSRATALLLAIATTILLAATHATPAYAISPCDGDNPPSSCFDTHTENQARTLTVTRSAGTVTSSPSGISCGSTCSASFNATRECDYYDCTDWSDPSVTLTAASGPSGFAPAWSGCTPSGSTCAVTLDASKSVSLGWTDVTDPTVGMTINSVNNKVGPSAIVSAVAGDNAGVSKVDFFVDGVLKATDTSAPYQALIDTASYADGSSHTFAVRATDTSGRTSGLASSARTVDRHVGVTAGAIPADVATKPSIAISTDSDATMKCALDGGAASSCSGTYAPATLAEGDHTYAVTATDDVGNTASVTRSFTYDPTAPAVAFTDGPTEGQVVATRAITVSFSATDARLSSLTCKLDGGAAGPCTSASTDSLSDLGDGTHTLTVAAVDRAGNRTEKTRTFVVSVPAPTGSGSGTGTGSGSDAPATPAASTPSTTTGSTTPTTPATTPAAPAAKRASLSAKSHRKGAATVFTSLKLVSLPKGAKVSVSCKGGGCPKKTKALSALLGRSLKPGAVVTIRITAPSVSAQTIKVTIRRGAAPKIA